MKESSLGHLEYVISNVAVAYGFFWFCNDRELDSAFFEDEFDDGYYTALEDIQKCFVPQIKKFKKNLYKLADSHPVTNTDFSKGYKQAIEEVGYEFFYA